MAALEESQGEPAEAPTFMHPAYELVDGDKIVRKDVPPPTSAEQDAEENRTLLSEMVRYVTTTMLSMGFHEKWIPHEEAEAKCPIYCTEGWESAPKLLVVIINQVGSQAGLWSRSLCFSHGLKSGSMLEYLQHAIDAGYAVMVLNPNSNSVTLPGEPGSASGGGGGRKVFIQDSSSPEEHTMGVWDNLVAQSAAAEIYLLAYGNGAVLAKDVLIRQLARSKEREDEVNRIVAVACIESSSLLESDDAKDISDFIASRFMDWEQTEFPEGFLVSGTRVKLGCVALSVGQMGADETRNAAWSVGRAMPSVFRFYDYAVQHSGAEGPIGVAFAREEALVHHLDPATAVSPAPAEAGAAGDGAAGAAAAAGGGADGKRASSRTKSPGMLSGMLRGLLGRSRGEGSGVGDHDMDRGLTVNDFDLLKVVGKGAFGKVMLVRKKSGSDGGEVYAMKVLKKSMIAAKGQVEHTKAERSILCEIRHPFVVCLQYAFQSEEKLYLITDYYSGGSLFYHLRKSRGFSENRAKFYAAELFLALQHLHDHHIIYRDLKLENVLMDHEGHIALTDFGLSKNQVDDVFESQLTTFCGTAEYIAPELLKGQKYGAAVDWWSFGILIYEMIGFRTPFFDKNRKLMFYGIINNEPTWQPHFSASATGIMKRLLAKSPTRRLGSGAEGANEIRNHKFFADIDFASLLVKTLKPPFKPDVKSLTDAKYVPKTYLNDTAQDSIDKSAKKSTNVDFEAFTYIPSQQGHLD